jgi:hypothetical protein
MPSQQGPRYPEALASGLIAVKKVGGFSPWGMLLFVQAKIDSREQP